MPMKYLCYFFFLKPPHAQHLWQQSSHATHEDSRARVYGWCEGGRGVSSFGASRLGMINNSVTPLSPTSKTTVSSSVSSLLDF